MPGAKVHLWGCKGEFGSDKRFRGKSLGGFGFAKKGKVRKKFETGKTGGGRR